MRAARILLGIVVGAPLPALAQQASTSTAPPVPTLDCRMTVSGGVAAGHAFASIPDAATVCDANAAAQGGKGKAWGDRRCRKEFWSYLKATSGMGQDPLNASQDVKGSKSLQAAWEGMSPDGRGHYLNQAVGLYKADAGKYDALTDKFLDASQACLGYAKQPDDKTGPAFQAASEAAAKALRDFTTPDNAQADPKAVSPDNRLGIFSSNKSITPGSEAKYVSETLTSWDSAIKAIAAKSAALAAQAKQQAAPTQQQAAVKQDEWTAKKAGFRAQLASGAPGSEQALSSELRSAFDQAGIKGVKIGEATKGAGGVVLVDISISTEDYAKLNSEQKAKLESLRIQPPPPGMKAAPFSFLGPDQQKRLDYFESTLFSGGSTAKLRFDSTASAVSDADAKQWVKAALGGSSVSKMAQDPHSEAELRDKLNAAKAKAAANYAEADSAALKKCQDNHDKLVQMGLDPHADDQRCAQERQNALLAYHGRLGAIADTQSHADQLSAAANSQRLQAYKEVLGSKKAANADLFGKQGMTSYWSAKGVDFGSAMARQQEEAKASYTALFKEMTREEALVDQALAKMPGVTSGDAPLSSVLAADPKFLGKVFAADGRIDDVYDEILGDKQRRFEEAMLVVEPAASSGFGFTP